MFESGAFVAEHVTPTTDEQVQPNGVDLRLEAVFEQREPGRIGRDGKEVGDRQRVPGETVGSGESGTADGAGDPGTTGGADEPGSADGAEDPGATDGAEAPGQADAVEESETYYLPPGGYVVRYAEVVSIPAGHVGFIYPRSSLLRNSCMLNTAVWDAGYEGKGEGLLQVHHDVHLERDARVAQLVLARADHEATYDGSYQGEHVG